MREILVSVLGLLCSACCADLALHAAAGQPRVGEPLSIASARRASREPDGSLRLCVEMRTERGAWPFLRDEFRLLNLGLPFPRSAAAVAIPYEAWLDNREPCEPLTEGATIIDLELIEPARIPVSELELQDQQLVVREGGEVMALLEPSGRRDSGNALYWPLVPVGYAVDAVVIPVGAAVGGVAYVAAKATEFVLVGAIVLIGTPINYLGEILRSDSEVGEPEPPPSPCASQPPDHTCDSP